MADEEDVALSAFKSFCLGFQQGKFPDPGTAPNLWPLLVSLTLNKAVDHVRRENRLKRRPPQPSDGRNSPKPALAGDADWNELVSREPTPELAAAAAESFQDLMAALDQTGDATLRRITLQSICGYTTSQLAKELGCTPRTVQRKLQTIRAIWEARQP
jgi:RNA polymerase sigma factor (sigma-70 family)